MTTTTKRTTVKTEKPLSIKVKRLHADARLPKYATDGSGAFDFYTPYNVYPSKLQHGKACLVPLGLAVEVPKGYVLKLYLRSSTAKNTPMRMANAVGIIDSDYRSEIGILLDTLKEYGEGYMKGERICQGIIEKVTPVTFVEVEELSETERGTGGYGSTGKA